MIIQVTRYWRRVDTSYGKLDKQQYTAKVTTNTITETHLPAKYISKSGYKATNVSY